MTGYNTWGVSWGTSWGVSWGSGSTPPPVITHRDQGAGAGRRKERVGLSTLDDYRKLGEALANSPQSKKKPAVQEIEPVSVKKAIQIRPSFIKQAKLGDLSEIRTELNKLSFAVEQEILSQAEEDEAIFMLMGMACQ